MIPSFGNNFFSFFMCVVNCMVESLDIQVLHVLLTYFACFLAIYSITVAVYTNIE